MIYLLVLAEILSALKNRKRWENGTRKRSEFPTAEKRLEALKSPQ
jgi:hypothetical protein